MDVDVTLPVVDAAGLEETEDARWLIESLWSHQAVGIIGGCPKVCKSWFGLDMAVSVASRTACLGHYEVHTPGPALVYLAEDALPRVRDRIASLCRSRGIDIGDIDLHVITASALRLDIEAHQRRLEATLAKYQPVLLVLDPLVRLHRLDENSSADIALILGVLRQLQRSDATAIALVHHMSKRSRTALGQALRGSSDIHAWADSSAYLVRGRDDLVLNIEHRAASAPAPIGLRLNQGESPHLTVTATQQNVDSPIPLAEALRRLLAAQSAPMTRAALRTQLRVNNARLGDAIKRLEADNHIERGKDGWLLKHNVSETQAQ